MFKNFKNEFTIRELSFRAMPLAIKFDEIANALRPSITKG